MLIFLTMIESPEARSKFEILYCMYRQIMFGAAVRILKNDHDSDDAVHDAFLKVLDILDDISNPESEQTRATLIVIARNTALNMQKKEKRNLCEPFEEEKHKDCTENIPETMENRQIIARAMHSLPEHYREILLLRYHMGCSANEISEILSISTENVKKRIQRARKALDDILQDTEVKQ